MNASQKTVKKVNRSRRNFLLGVTAAAVIGIPAAIEAFSTKPKGWQERLGTQASLEEVLRDVRVSNVKKMRQVPHFSQDSSAYGPLPKNLCTPIAASNILIWYAQNGFPNLIAGFSGSREEVHYKIVVALAEYMKTSKAGTLPENAKEGVKRYVEEKGYKLSPTSWTFDPSQKQLGEIGRDSLAIVRSAQYYPGSEKYFVEGDKVHDVTLVEIAQNKDKLFLIARDSELKAKGVIAPYASLVTSEITDGKYSGLKGKQKIENALSYPNVTVVMGILPLKLAK